MSLASTIFSPYAVSVAARVGAQVNAFILIMVASRALDLSEFGSYAIAWALSVIFTTMVYTGIYHLLMRTSDLERDIDTFFWLQLAMGASGTVVMGTAGLAVSLTGASQTAFALIALAPVPFVAAFGAWNEAQLMRAGRVRLTSLLVLAAEIAALVTAIAMFRAGFGIEALVAARYASTLLSVLVTFVAVRRLPRLIFRRDVTGPSLKEAWPLWGSASLAMLSNYGADLILGGFLHSAAVGAFRAGSRVANTAADVVLQPLSSISWARFARLESQHARGEIKEVWLQNMGLGFALIAPVMISISLLAGPIVETLFDPSWGAVAIIVSILALGRTMDSFMFLLEPTMTCLGRARLQLYVRLASAILLVVLLVSLGRFSAELAAIAVFLENAIIALVSLGLMMSVAKLSISEVVEALTPGLGLSLACVAVIYALDPARGMLSPVLGLSLTVGALFLLWCAVVAGLLRRKVLVLPTP